MLLAGYLLRVGLVARKTGAVILVMLILVPVAMGQNWLGWDWDTVGLTTWDADGNAMTTWAGAETDGGALPVLGPLDKPFLIVEGFDPRNDKPGPWYYHQEKRFFGEARRAKADIVILDLC